MSPHSIPISASSRPATCSARLARSTPAALYSAVGNGMLSPYSPLSKPIMYTEFGSGSDIDALHDALFQGAIARLNNLTKMSAIVVFTQNFLEERLAPDRAGAHSRNGRRSRRTMCRAPARLCEQRRRSKSFGRTCSRRSASIRKWRCATGSPCAFSRQGRPSGERPWARSTATVAFHRDTWGTNLYAQVNWWAPVYPITAGRTFAFLPELFARPLKNNSSDFDIVALMERNRGRGLPVGQGEMVPQLQEQIDLSIAQPVTISPGELIVFSSQHAHVGVVNSTDLTRISLETRTLRLADLETGRGAPNVDGRARWVSYGMFRRIADGKPLPEILGISPFVPFRAKSA